MVLSGSSRDNARGDLETGSIVEDFSAIDQHGQERTLAELVANGPLVLFFYPKAMTPG